MNSEKKFLNKRRSSASGDLSGREAVGLFSLFVAAVSIFGAVAISCGCASTVAPKIVVSTQASWDASAGGANVQNSGLIDEDVNHNLIVTPHARDRYNALVATYGAKFKPPLISDQDITPTGTNTFLLAPVGFEHFRTMLRWDKQVRSAVIR